MANETNILNGDVQFYREPNKTWDARGVDCNKIIPENDKLNSVSQSIWLILNTERYSNPIYSNAYGVELQQFIGESEYFLEANIEDVLKDALTHDDRITNVTVNNVSKIDSESCLVDYTVNTIYGTLEEKLNVRI